MPRAFGDRRLGAAALIKRAVGGMGLGHVELAMVQAEAAKALAGVHSAFDKAVKSGVVSRPTANRKKSRLAHALAGVK